MKKIILGIIAITCSSYVYGQTWLGSTTATGDLFRSGNVGIGTITSPSAYLHIQSPSGYQFKLERSNSGHNNTLGIFITTDVGIGSGSVFFQCTNPLGVSDMVFKPTPTMNALVLKANGKVLIGDPSAVNLNTVNDYKLYVQTGILTEKVKVALTANWADYVFEKNYTLKSLDDVKLFVNSNKHLPGIPSAQEIKDDGGFDLGEMNIKLLEKIEELTLYIIQLNEKNKELANRLAKLEAVK